MFDNMTAYDAAAWKEIQAWRVAQDTKKSVVPKTVRSGLAKGRQVVSTGWDKVPGGDAFMGLVLRAAEGMHEVVTETATRSVSTGMVLAKYAKAGHEVSALRQIRNLELEAIDKVRPSLTLRYMAGMGSSGAMAGGLSGGATLVAGAGTAASAGAAAVPGAAATAAVMATDIVSTLAASIRLISHTAAFYGYDTRDEAEKAFAWRSEDWDRLRGDGEASRMGASFTSSVGQLARGATCRSSSRTPSSDSPERCSPPWVSCTKRKSGRPFRSRACFCGLASIRRWPLMSPRRRNSRLSRTLPDGEVRSGGSGRCHRSRHRRRT